MSATLVGIVLISAFLGYRYYLRGRGQSRRSDKPSSPKFPGVAIESNPGADTCAAMQRLEGKRFLPDDAPMLPLAECDLEQCHCCYVRYRDRRSGDDRRWLYAANSHFVQTEEHRSNPGRRASDKDDEDIVLS